MPPPVGGDAFINPAPPAPPPQPYIAPAPVPARPPSYNYDPPVRSIPREVPREEPRYTPPSRNYEPPSYSEPLPRETPRYDPPGLTPPLYDDGNEQPREQRKKAPCKPKLKAEGDAWSENQRERENYRVPNPTPPCSPRRNVCTYRVQPGDTLTDIAEERYGVSGPKTIANILAVNPGLDPDRIYAGQKLLLPKSLACASEPPPCPCAPTRREHVREFDHGYNNALQLIPISTQVRRE